MTEDNQKQNFFDVLILMLKDQKIWMKSIGTIIIFLFILAFAIEYFLWRFTSTDKVLSIGFSSNGAFITIDPSKKIKATFTLHASQRWTNSGIKIPPNSTVHVSASGQIHLAAHHIIDNANKDKRPPFPYIGPKGRDWENIRPKEERRKKGLIDPQNNIGSLLVALVKPDGTEPDVRDNPRPKELRHIGDKAIIKNDFNQEVELWFIVNDVALFSNDLEKSKDMYMGPSRDLTEKEEKDLQERWNYIKQEGYWDLWWDDNIGHFNIQIDQVK